jgi:hypothetical protein
MASIESRLEHLGQEDPTSGVDLRRWKGREQHFETVLKLSIDDAREFMVDLGYLVEAAPGKPRTSSPSADITDRPGVVPWRSTS